MMSDITRVISELGLGAGLAVLMFVAFFFLLKWVLEVSKDQLIQMAEERKAWTEVISNFNAQIADLSTNNRAFHNSVQDAHKFQREEHQEMIKSLGRINGYKGA